MKVRRMAGALGVLVSALFAAPCHGQDPALLPAFKVSLQDTWGPVWVPRGPFDTAVVSSLVVADGVAYAATPGGVQALDASSTRWSPPALRAVAETRLFARPGSPIYAVGQDGVLRVSRDRGERWDSITLDDWAVSVAVDRESPAVAYALGAAAIWKTTDAGVSWTRLAREPGGPVAAVVASDGALLVLTSEQRLFRSTDHGLTFSPAAGFNVMAISVGAESGLLYVTANSGRHCRSADQGATWPCSNDPAPISVQVELPAASAGGPVRLVGADDGSKFYGSDDAGATWRPLADLGERERILSLTFGQGRLWAGTERGVYDSADGGSTWTPRNTGLAAPSLKLVAVDPVDSGRLLLADRSTVGPNVFRSSDGGQAWSESGSRLPLAVQGVVFHPTRRGVLFGTGAESSSGVISSDDGGVWEALDFNPLALAISEAADEMWAAASSGTYRSDDGVSWTAGSLTDAIYSLIYDGQDPATLYAGSFEEFADYGYSYPFPSGGTVFTSRDGGLTWARTDGLGAPVLHLAVDPTVSGVAYASTDGGGVHHSEDFGAHWQRSVGDEGLSSATALVADPIRAGVAYAASTGTVYRSLDGARTWVPFGVGLETSWVTGLAVSPDGDTLYAATYGSGLLAIDLRSAPRPAFPCVADASRLCLVGARYAVTLAVRDDGSTRWVPALEHAVGDRSGYFAFPQFTGDAGLPEVLIKMLGEGALGPGGASVFFGSVTSLPYVLTVTDTKTGGQRVYGSRADAPFCGGSHFPFPPASQLALDARSAASAATIPLLGGRFVATVAARTPYGAAAEVRPVALGDGYGYFSFPSVTGDPALPEVLVKMIDARAFGGKFWLFYTGLTSLDYTLTLEDTETGAVRSYESPGSLCGQADTSIPAR